MKQRGLGTAGASDVRHGLRALARTPTLTLGAIATLALAIGANSAIFSVVRGVLVRQLPFRDAERVFWIWSDQPGRDRSPFNVPDFADYRDQNRSLQGLGGYFGASVNLSDSDSTERLQGIRATGNAFEVLGLQARRPCSKGLRACRRSTKPLSPGRPFRGEAWRCRRCAALAARWTPCRSSEAVTVAIPTGSSACAPKAASRSRVRRSAAIRTDESISVPPAIAAGVPGPWPPG